MKSSPSAGTTSRRQRWAGWRSCRSEYGLGLQIQQVQLATVRPPAAVQAAFNEVNQAQQEKQTAINQAWAVYNDAVPERARPGQGARETSGGLRVSPDQRGQGRHRKIFSSPGGICQGAGDHAARLYFESMESILPALERKVIVDDSIKGVLQTLPLLRPRRLQRPQPAQRYLTRSR